MYTCNLKEVPGDSATLDGKSAPHENYCYYSNITVINILLTKTFKIFTMNRKCPRGIKTVNGVKYLESIRITI